jgi:hypothetical protein
VPELSPIDFSPAGFAKDLKRGDEEPLENFPMHV